MCIDFRSGTYKFKCNKHRLQNNRQVLVASE